MPLAGIAVCVKKKGSPTAEITKVIHVIIKRHRYSLLPGIETTLRRVTVNGSDNGDIPTKYTMTGLQPYEIPVVGEYCSFSQFNFLPMAYKYRIKNTWKLAVET